MRKVTKLWTTKDGRRIRICDMDDRHLTNTIAMLERQARLRQIAMPFPNFSGEMAQYYAEGEYEFAQDHMEYFYPELIFLYRERGRR